MEVLKTDDKLREEIINDAKVKAERILSKAKSDSAEIQKNAKEQLDKIDSDYFKIIEKEIALEVKKIFASVDIEVKKKTLELTGNIIDTVFNNIKNSIIDGKLIAYKDFILKLLQNASAGIKSTSYIIEADKKEIAKIGKDSLKSLKLTGGEVKEIIESEVDGVMLYSSDRKKAVFVSLNYFFERLKQDESIKVYEILVKGEA